MPQLRSGFASYQIFTYILSTIMLPLTMYSFWPLWPPYISLTIPVIYSIIYVQVVFMTIFEPASTELKEKIRYNNFKRKPFNGRHAIVNSFCTICEVRTFRETKHCRRCNFCIDDFDHHCIWLNNCIGGKNYRPFVVLVVCVNLASTYATGLSLYMLISWFVDSEAPSVFKMAQTGGNLTEEMEKDLKMNPVDWLKVLWVCCCFTCLFVYGVVAASTAHLLHFHFKLFKVGQTTYRYITSRRRGARIGAISHVSPTHSLTHRREGEQKPEGVQLDDIEISRPPPTPRGGHVTVTIEGPTPTERSTAESASYSNQGYQSMEQRDASDATSPTDQN